MKPGFKVHSYIPYLYDIVVCCINYELENTVTNIPLNYNPKRASSLVGVWQPKGTKLKQLNK